MKKLPKTFEAVYEDKPSEVYYISMLAKDNNGWTPLHWAASYGHLDQVPREFLTLETMLEKDRWGNTPLYNSAVFGHLDQVPKEFLTIETMLTEDNDGNTPLHGAVSNLHLDQVPKELLTLETLLAKNNDGDTPLHWAVNSGKLGLLLGIDFGDSQEAKDIVGEEWWAEIKAHPKKIVYKFVQYSEEVDI